MRTCLPCCPRIRRALERKTWCLWWASYNLRTPTPARRNAWKAFSTRTVSSLRPLPTPELAPSSTYPTTPTKAYGANILEGDGTGFWRENLSSIPSTSSHQVRGSSTEFLPTPLSDPPIYMMDDMNVNRRRRESQRKLQEDSISSRYNEFTLFLLFISNRGVGNMYWVILESWTETYGSLTTHSITPGLWL